MARVPTSKDVAQAAGVSQSTVSYVMSGKRPISEKTRRLVEDAMARLLYQPNAGARALAGRRTQVIALVVPFDGAWGATGLVAFVEGITVAARRHDHDVLLVTADEGVAGLRRLAGRALCDAIVVMEVRTDEPRAQVARDPATPTLFIGVPTDADGLHCIDFDFENGARLLVTELLAAGHDRIGVLGWPGTAVDRGINYVPRFHGAARRTAEEHRARLLWVQTEVDRVDEQVAALVADGVGGLLVVCELPRVLGALQRRGLRPGTDVDVVALATDAEATSHPVPLTAVSQRPRDVSREAMEWLFALLDDPAGEPGVRRVPASITRRASVRTTGGEVT